jgi:hypothetical protein
MIVAYAFVGTLPSYSIDTVKQMRLFYSGDIYFIVDDYSSPYIETLVNEYSVKIVKYHDVVHHDFCNLINSVGWRFKILGDLKGREKLFIYSFERFFLLYNLMNKENLQDIFFLELDNLVYDNPENWMNEFKKKDMAYLFDNIGRCSTAIAYIKNTDILHKFMQTSFTYIIDNIRTDEWLNEMSALFIFWENNKNLVQLLPTHWNTDIYPTQTYETYSNYNKTIFDALSIGIYLTGVHPFHSNGILTLGIKSEWGLIDYTKYIYEWKLDEKGRKIPYVLNGSEWIRINNLHVHSKNLSVHLSS